MDEVTLPKAAFEALKQQISTLQATVDRLNAIIEEKNQIILNQNRARFGQSSEKRTYLLADGQLRMFEQAGDGITEKAREEVPRIEKQSVSVAAHTRKPKRTLEELAANLPEEPVILDLPDAEKYTQDGRPLKYIGTDLIRSELVKEPARIYVKKYYCRTYTDPVAEALTGKADIRRPVAPAPLLPHSYASASVVTDIIVKKYADALPLYRQEQMWKRMGVDLKRNTMANWVIQTAELYLKPFSDAFLRELLKQAAIHADETVVQVNKEPGRDATAESRIWACASSKRAERQIRYFRYEESRKGACAAKVLGGYKGVVITSTISTFSTKGVTAVKTFMTAVSSAGGGFKGLISVISSSPAAIAVFAAATAYGIYKLIDWASGAKAAREAQERLNETVKQWGENVTTAYEKSEGLSKFGLTAEDFSIENIGTDWLQQTIATWTDGKLETDEILNDTVKGFTDGTEKIRSSLQSLKDSAGGTALGDLDGDLAALDAIDAEVQQILSRKQNGFLSDDETARLQSLMDQREAIQIKYHLVADMEGAFGQIADGVEAALSRGADGAAAYTDAFAAATQGMGAFTDSLNAEYDARYKVISTMEDGAEKERQLGELRTWYDTQAQAATEQYYNTLQQTAQATGVFAEGGQFAETAAKLSEINTLMSQAAGKDGMSAEMNALRDALAGLDETSIVELETAISAMETAAADAGQSVPEEVLAAKTALEEVKAAATDTSNVFSEDVATSIDTMFSGLGDETHEVFASLNCENLSTAYDAWAQGEHQAIIPTLDTESLTEIDLTGNITNVLAQEGATFEVDTSGNITEVKWPEGTTFETDVKGNITEATTPEGTVYTVDAEGHITSVSKPDGVTYSVDTQGNVTGITTPDGTAFTVDAEGNVTSITTGGDNSFTVDCTGNIKDVTWPEGTTYETDVNGNVTGMNQIYAYLIIMQLNTCV